jgi:phage tail-like protein
MAERSSYLEYLPAIFQQDADDGGPNDTGAFLLAFEHVLTGLRDVEDPGLEEVLDGTTAADTQQRLAGIERYFDPGVRVDPDTLAERVLPESERVPDAPGDAFLNWLAGWVALVPRGDVGREIKRRLIANAVGLYRLRGTKEGLERLLEIYTGGVTIEEPTGWLQVGVESRVGVDTRIDGPPPHYFRVTRAVDPAAASSLPAAVDAELTLLGAILDAEKPAHTRYDLDVTVPEFEVGVRSTVGVDTMLG